MSTDNTDGRSFIFDFLSAAVCVWPKSLISIVRFYLVCTSCSERTQQGNIVLKNIFVFGICLFFLFFLLVSSISACCTSFVCTCLLFLVFGFVFFFNIWFEVSFIVEQSDKWQLSSFSPFLKLILSLLPL